MSAPSLASGARRLPQARAVESAGRQGPGVYVWLLAVWIFFEFGKPTAQAFKIPMLITLVVFLAWLAASPKRLPRQLVLALLFVGLMALHIPFARNNYHAYWATYYMAVTLMIVCPMVQFVDSLAKLRFLVNVFVGTFVMIGAWAATHGGFGPLGAESGQDQNYVGQAMSMGLGLAFFSIFTARSSLLRLVYAAASGLFALATVVGFSRGGFIGLCAVGFYCWLRSPRKLLAGVLVAVLGGVVVETAAPGYWNEMRTITNTKEETSDMRIQLWKIAWREFLHHPVAGVAPGNFKWYAGDYQSADQYGTYDRSFAGAYVTHSLYFELLSELGLIGTLLFAGILAADFRDKRWIAEVARQRAGDVPALREAQYLSRGLTGAMVGFLVSSLFLSNLYNSYFWVLAGLTAGLRASTAQLVAELDAAPPAEDAPRG